MPGSRFQFQSKHAQSKGEKLIATKRNIKTHTKIFSTIVPFLWFSWKFQISWEKKEEWINSLYLISCGFIISFGICYWTTFLMKPLSAINNFTMRRLSSSHRNIHTNTNMNYEKYYSVLAIEANDFLLFSYELVENRGTNTTIKNDSDKKKKQ